MNQKGLLLWVGAAAGIILLYSAYKDENPLTVLNRYNGSGSDTGNKVGSAAFETPVMPALPAMPKMPAFDSNGLPVDAPSVYHESPATYIPAPNSYGY